MEAVLMPAKTKAQTAANPTERLGKDFFQTPRYATEIIMPFVPQGKNLIWEPAAGDGRMSQVIEAWTRGWASVVSTDLIPNPECHINGFNFLGKALFPKELITLLKKDIVIVTNPPFSLKKEFYLRCLETGFPFALLIPSDWSGWLIEAFNSDGAEAIMPNRRVDFITPNVLRRIHEGEIWKKVKTCDEFLEYKSLAELKKKNPQLWGMKLGEFHDFMRFDNIDDVPNDLLSSYSSSDFHSMWLTWGFNLGKQFTFVDLSIDDKKRIK